MLKSLVFLFTILGVLLICCLLYCFFSRSVKVDRMLAKGEYKTLIFVIIFVLSVPLTTAGALFLLGKSGGLFVAECTGNNPNILWTMLYHCIDPGNQHMAVEGWPRVLVCLIALFGTIFMNGVLISSIVSLYERHINKWEKGLARYPGLLKKCNYIVIIGSNELIPDLIKQIFKRKVQVDYVVVQLNKDIETFRKYLSSFLTVEEEKRVILYSGEQTSVEDISDLFVEYAKEVFILGDSVEDEYDKTNHDALNMKCLQIISDRLQESASNRRLICRVMFEYQTSFSIFQFADISDKICSFIDFRPFNYYELWAQRIFVNRKLSFKKEDLAEYLPLEGERPITYESEDFVHLVIVGMSKMGVSLAVEAAHLSHYPNFTRDSNLKTRITFIDEKCDKEMGYFMGRFKELFSLSKWRYMDSVDLSKGGKEWQNEDYFKNVEYLGEDFMDVEWEFIKGGIESEEIHSYLKNAVTNKKARFTLAICFPQDNQSVAASLYLPDEVYENAIQVLVYQRHNASIINSISLDNKINLYYKQLKAFGMLFNAYDDNLMETTHFIAHELGNKYYEMYQRVNANNNIRENSRNNIRGKSKAAKTWSNIYNANTIWSKLRSARSNNSIDDKMVKIFARTEHNRWVIEQLLMRFRALTKEEQDKVISGELNKEVLKGDKMAHLDICSYDRLSVIDTIVCEYDEGFIKIIPSILNAINSPEGLN